MDTDLRFDSLEEDSYEFDIEPDDIDVQDTVTVVWSLE